MNSGNLVQVNGKKEKAVKGKVVVEKPEDVEEKKWLKKTIQIFYGVAGTKYEVCGKVNTVQMQDSKGADLELDTVVSGIEITNCQKATVKAKANQEFWTVNVNKCNGVVIALNDTIVKGGKEFLEAGEKGVPKEFNCIAAAFDDVKIQKGSKQMSLPSKFEFKMDTSGESPKWIQTEYSGKIDKVSKGVEMAEDGEGFKATGAKGKTVYVSGKKGKKNAVPLAVEGACDMVVLDDCKKVTLTVDSALKGIVVQNCKQVKITVKKGGKVPKVTVVNSHGCYVTLEELVPDFSLVANQWSDTNVNFPFGDSTSEMAIAEQFVFKVAGDSVEWSLPTF